MAVLLFSALLSFQCVASCGTIAPPSRSEENLPPCHQHLPNPVHESAPPCCHDSILAGTDQQRVELAGISVPPVAAITLLDREVDIAAFPTFDAPSTPEVALPPLAVLRI